MIKNEIEDYSIISEPIVTMLHPVIDIDITEYASRILSSRRKAGARFKPLFAIVTGMGRGKTRTLVEIQRELNKKSDVLCLALTFNSHWAEILESVNIPKNQTATKQYAYIYNVVARIISMCYHITIHDCSKLLDAAFQTSDYELSTPSDIIHECVEFIIDQYRARGVQVFSCM